MPNRREGEEFQVSDRRRFTAEGALREEAEGERAEPSPKVSAPPRPRPPSEPKPEQPGAQAAASRQARQEYEGAGPAAGKVTFESLVLSHAQAAMLQLGLLAVDPAQPLEPDLAGARETIDLLGLLQEKTRGNLTPEEDRLLDNALYELRMAWMEASRAS